MSLNSQPSPPDGNSLLEMSNEEESFYGKFKGYRYY